MTKEFSTPRAICAVHWTSESQQAPRHTRGGSLWSWWRAKGAAARRPLRKRGPRGRTTWRAAPLELHSKALAQLWQDRTPDKGLCTILKGGFRRVGAEQLTKQFPVLETGPGEHCSVSDVVFLKCFQRVSIELFTIYYKYLLTWTIPVWFSYRLYSNNMTLLQSPHHTWLTGLNVSAGLITVTILKGKKTTSSIKPEMDSYHIHTCFSRCYGAVLPLCLFCCVVCMFTVCPCLLVCLNAVTFNLYPATILDRIPLKKRSLYLSGTNLVKWRFIYLFIFLMLWVYWQTRCYSRVDKNLQLSLGQFDTPCVIVYNHKTPKCIACTTTCRGSVTSSVKWTAEGNTWRTEVQKLSHGIWNKSILWQVQ